MNFGQAADIGYAVETAVAVVRWINERRKVQMLIDPDWLGSRLVAAGFARDDVDRWADECVDRLKLAGIWYRAEADYLLADRRTREHLAILYRDALARPGGQVDPLGYCTWGPPLHRSRRAAWPLMRDLIRQKLVESAEGRDNRDA